MTAFIAPPPRIPWYLCLGLRVARRRSGRDLLPAQLLAWYPRAALGSGVLESLVAHREPSRRLLKLVRVTASLTASCPFCVDMNSFGAAAAGVAEAELAALQRGTEGGLATLTPRERAAIAYANAMTTDPHTVTQEQVDDLRRRFGAAGVVELTYQVGVENMRARMNSALGITEQGFGSGESCRVPWATEAN